jgi:hypothetical protein
MFDSNSKIMRLGFQLPFAIGGEPMLVLSILAPDMPDVIPIFGSSFEVELRVGLHILPKSDIWL